MKLMTKSIEKKLENFGERSQEGMGLNATVVVKYFNPFGAGTWLITEGTKLDDGDFLLFGLCHISDWDWGSVLLSEMESISIIERDMYLSENTTIRQALIEMGINEDKL